MRDIILFFVAPVIMGIALQLFAWWLGKRSEK